MQASVFNFQIGTSIHFKEEKEVFQEKNPEEYLFSRQPIKKQIKKIT
jgi:hypothetical protein